MASQDIDSPKGNDRQNCKYQANACNHQRRIALLFLWWWCQPGLHAIPIALPCRKLRPWCISMLGIVPGLEGLHLRTKLTRSSIAPVHRHVGKVLLWISTLTTGATWKDRGIA